MSIGEFVKDEAAKVVEEVRRDLPEFEQREATIILAELSKLRSGHSSTAQMTSETFHQTIDLLLELILRGRPTPAPSST